ncbi:MAG: ABC transporter permease subunit [Anaerolineae bacterium]|jgi:ABC-2 type transport system permease protein|nr:ABC transporter permease subunit [Chloroflexota bacterium]
MRILMHELRRNAKSLLTWSGILMLFVVVGFAKFSAWYGNPEMLAMLDAMPPAMLSALSLRAFNLTTVTGFFGVMAAYYALLLAIAAVLWGSDVLAREERERTAEFTLTLPVTRGRLLTAKLAAVVLCALVLNGVAWGATLLGARGYAPEPALAPFVTRTMLALLMLQGIFVSVGICLAAVLPRPRRTVSAAVGVLLGTYFVSVIAGLDARVDWLKYLTPFRYVDAGVLLRQGALPPVYRWISAALIVTLLAATYLTYQRRDLHL